MKPPSASTVGASPPEMRTSSVRVPELEDPLNHYVYHPLAFRLAKLLQPTGLSPNAVSGVSGALVCIAAVLYTGVAWPIGALAGFGCHLLWHVADGADGDLARLTGKASPIGEFVDGAADYLSHIFMYLLLAATLDDGAIGIWAWPLVSFAGVSRIVQANHTETQRRQYLWRAYGVPWLRTQRDNGKRVFTEQGWFSRGSARIMRAYLLLGERMAPYSAPLDEALQATGQERRQADARALVRASARRSLLLQKGLGANPRTILLGCSMIIGTPLWFFLVEAVALNGVLVASIARNNAVERRLLASLQAAPAR